MSYKSVEVARLRMEAKQDANNNVLVRPLTYRALLDVAEAAHKICEGSGYTLLAELEALDDALAELGAVA